MLTKSNGTQMLNIEQVKKLNWNYFWYYIHMFLVGLLYFLIGSLFSSAVIRGTKHCIHLQLGCLEYSCYEKCVELSSETVIRGSLKLCGNKTFVDCLFEKHWNKGSACIKRYQACLQSNDSSKPENNAGRVDNTVIAIASVACSVVLMIIAFFSYRFITRTSVRRNARKTKKFVRTKHSKELVMAWRNSCESEEGKILNKNSIWSNVYITKLQDYETSDEERSM